MESKREWDVEVSTGRPSSDARLMSQVIGLHYTREPKSLDATWGLGALWRGCAYQPTVRFDRRPMPGVDVVGEWQDLPRLFAPSSFQMVVWDPPHQTDGGERAFTKGAWSEAYGTAMIRGSSNISHLYPDFLEAARHVLTPDGMLLAKIADQVHQNAQQLQAVDFVVAARSARWTVCEMVPKMRRPTPNDPRWRRQLHIRKAWSYWICAHPGDKCPAEGVALLFPCKAPRCDRYFPAHRSDAETCSPTCEKRLWRARQKAADVRVSSSSAQQLTRTPRGTVRANSRQIPDARHTKVPTRE